MKIIKNSKELSKLVDDNKDLHLEDEDVRIEYQVEEEELRNIYCRDLFLMNDDKRFDFNGYDFNGYDFNGGDFNGLNFNGLNFNGYDFKGYDFNGYDFNGYDFNGLNFNGLNFNGYDFNGYDFNGYDFNGYDFNGLNFNGLNFNGGDFNGLNFNGNDFTGKKVSYWAFFNCCGSIKCESIEGRREPHAEPVCIDGEIEIISEEPITLSMDEIAEKFNIPVDKLKIKKGLALLPITKLKNN